MAVKNTVLDIPTDMGKITELHGYKSGKQLILRRTGESYANHIQRLT